MIRRLRTAKHSGRSLNSAGFTIIELVIAMSAGLVVSGLVIFFGFNFWRSGALQQADQETLITRLNAGDYIRENVGESTGLINQNSLADSHTMAADEDQPSGHYWQIIHAVSPDNIPVGATGSYTPLLYFRKLSINTSNNIIMNGTNPYEDEHILYLDGTTKQLLARTIANPIAPNNKAVTTCPPAQATSLCPADKVVAEDVASIDTRYFSRNGSVLNHEATTDSLTGEFNGPDFPLVEVVELTINLEKAAAFEHSASSINNTVIRISIRNG